jgi:pimeloyl-ACP methyl ester carboxylesterase
MTSTLAIKPPAVKPLEDWGSVSVELLGTQTRIVQGKNFSHRVIECGTQGEPLILIHGVGGHAETYARNLHNLANNGFHVYAIDALYHGFSSKGPQVDNRTEKQADALADLIEALGYKWAHVEGESMGAGITFAFGIKYPQMSGKLILNTGGGSINLKKTDFPENPGGGNTLQELSQRSIMEPNFANTRARMEWLVREPKRMTDEMVHVRVRLYSFPEIYESIKWIYGVLPGQTGMSGVARRTYEEEEVKELFKPQALVFWTDQNPGQGPAYGEYLSNVIPGAKFYSMADAAHWPQWEKPEEHDQVLIDFIKGK